MGEGEYTLRGARFSAPAAGQVLATADVRRVGIRFTQLSGGGTLTISSRGVPGEECQFNLVPSSSEEFLYKDWGPLVSLEWFNTVLAVGTTVLVTELIELGN